MRETFPQLNLPAIDARISKDEENYYIYDPVRKKSVVLTSEEWVRQHFIQLLIEHLDYPRGLLKVESGLKYFKTQKRSDLVAYDSNGAVFLLLECKGPDIKLNAATLAQLSTYNKTLDARYLAISNGIKHFCWQKLPDEDRYEALKDFPRYKA